MLCSETLRSALVHCRENQLAPTYDDPALGRATGLLRRAMIDYLVKYRPESAIELLNGLPSYLKAGTDWSREMQHVKTVINIVMRHSVPDRHQNSA